MMLNLDRLCPRCGSTSHPCRTKPGMWRCTNPHCHCNFAGDNDRHHALPPWYGMDVVGELPPAVKTRKNVSCQRCEYRADCETNMHSGGAALCEVVVVEMAGGERMYA